MEVRFLFFSAPLKSSGLLSFSRCDCSASSSQACRMGFRAIMLLWDNVSDSNRQMVLWLKEPTPGIFRLASADPTIRLGHAEFDPTLFKSAQRMPPSPWDLHPRRSCSSCGIAAHGREPCWGQLGACGSCLPCERGAQAWRGLAQPWLQQVPVLGWCDPAGRPPVLGAAGGDDGGGGGDGSPELTGARWAWTTTTRRTTRCTDECSWCGRLRPAWRGCDDEEGDDGFWSARLYPPPPELPRGPTNSHPIRRIYCSAIANRMRT